MSNINQRLNGLDVFAYMGSNANQPTDFRTQSFDPTPNDSKNFYLGTWWLNTSTLALWYLANLDGGIATWLRVTLDGASEFEGNTGGIVTPDATGLLHIVGDGSTVTVAGNPGTNTLTISTVTTGFVRTLTGNSGGAVSPTAQNINIVGDGTTISIVGNPGTSTLTASVIGGQAADSFPTDSGTATPTAGVLNVLGGDGIATTGAGNTVTIDSTATFSADSGTATPTAGGNLTIHGGTGVTTSASGSTVTVTASGVAPAATCSFTATLQNSHAAYFANGVNTIVLFDTVQFDNGSNYSTITNLFTAPADGLYFFIAYTGLSLINSATNEMIYEFQVSTGAIYTGNVGDPYAMSVHFATPQAAVFGMSAYINLSAGDTVGVYMYLAGPGGTPATTLIGSAGVGGSFRTYFSGWRVV